MVLDGGVLGLEIRYLVGRKGFEVKVGVVFGLGR